VKRAEIIQSDGLIKKRKFKEFHATLAKKNENVSTTLFSSIWGVGKKGRHGQQHQNKRELADKARGRTRKKKKNPQKRRCISINPSHFLYFIFFLFFFGGASLCFVQ
jgi:hypothetical protein